MESVERAPVGRALHLALIQRVDEQLFVVGIRPHWRVQPHCVRDKLPKVHASHGLGLGLLLGAQKAGQGQSIQPEIQLR